MATFCLIHGNWQGGSCWAPLGEGLRLGGHDAVAPDASPAWGLPLAEHPDVATALIYASDDEFFTPEWEQFVARELLAIEPIEMPGGHFPMIEDPAALAELLARLAPA